METSEVIVRVALPEDTLYAEQIVNEMEASAKVRGTGIARRSPEMINAKILQGKAVIAVTSTGQWVGFSYVESWQQGEFVSNSGLIVSPAFRQQGVASLIKRAVFDLSRRLYPDAKIFSITTGSAVMKLNSQLGFLPVAYNDITHDTAFWKGCESCANYEILCSKGCHNCLCTAMLYDPAVMEKQPA